jgi:hypothetical protein
MALGTLLALVAGIVWIVCTTTWQQMDAQDSRKQLGQEVIARSIAVWFRRAGGSRTMVRAGPWWKPGKKSSEDLD